MTCLRRDEQVCRRRISRFIHTRAGYVVVPRQAWRLVSWFCAMILATRTHRDDLALLQG